MGTELIPILSGNKYSVSCICIHSTSANLNPYHNSSIRILTFTRSIKDHLRCYTTTIRIIFNHPIHMILAQHLPLDLPCILFLSFNPIDHPAVFVKYAKIVSIGSPAIFRRLVTSTNSRLFFLIFKAILSFSSQLCLIYVNVIS